MYKRFNLNERIQHVLLILTFVILMITGFSLMFPYSIWTVLTIRLLGGFYVRGLIHRSAAVLFIALCIYHFFAIIFTKTGKKETKELFPRLKDFSDLIAMLQYFIGLKKDKPKFGRFSYVEKSEYWALVWGSIIMIITGILLWAMPQTIGYFTKLAFDIAKVIHGYEAILAGLALLVWHFYHVHLNPEDFPFKNTIWIDGKISKEKMEKEHPLELERM